MNSDRRDDKHQHIAAIGQLEPGVEDQRLDRQQRKEQREERQKLTDKRDQRAAAGAAQPGAPIAAREFGSDRIGGRYRDDDMQHRRHHRPQQKAGIIECGVGQDILLDDQRPAADRTAGETSRSSDSCDTASEIAVAQALATQYCPE